MGTMNSGLSGPAGYGEGVFSTSTLAAGSIDDGSVQVDISSVFSGSGIEFFGSSYTSLYVNSNGLISFDGPDTTYAGSSLDDLTGPSIAPFWADHSIGSGGEIYWDLDPSTSSVTITWHNAAPYSGSGANSYQVVLTDTGGGDFDVEFIYEDVQWTGNAQVGITDGGSNVHPFDGSGDPSELANYESNDFGGGDPAGNFVVSITDGTPVLPDGIVDGGTGNDSFVLSNLDLAGDAVTTGADVILAGDGDDSVDANDGADTIHGGVGNDTLLGGAGDDLIHGEGFDGATTSTSTSITDSNFTDTSSGFTVSARNVSAGSLTTASTANVSATMGGFGASGTVSDSDSGVQEQTGFDLASGLSEELIIEFDNDIDSLSFSFFALYTDAFGEQAQWTLYNDGTQIAQSTFTEIGVGSGSGTIDLSGYGNFDRIEFTGLVQTDGTDGSDFFISEVTFTDSSVPLLNDDSILGGDGFDTIFGGIGNDTIFGESGNDVISGEIGDDSILGGEGNDFITGGQGNDTIEGGIGNDTIAGGIGDDLIYGGDGNDFLTTGLGNDTLFGGDGDDTLKNSAGDDSLVGGAGNDSIVATIGDDTLEGGDGDDTLLGGIHDDSLDGGAGNDSLKGDFAAGGLTSTNQSFAYEYYELDSAGSLSTLSDAGFDTGGADNSNSPDGQGTVDTFDFSSIDAQHDGNDDTFAVKLITTLTVTTGGTYTFDLTSDHGAQIFINSVLVADNDGANTVSTASGSTVLSSGEHLVEVIYFENTGTETLSVDISGSDTGGIPIPLENTAVATSFDDTIEGGSGQDTIEGGIGDDSLSGGADEDTFKFSDNFGNDTVAGGEFGTDFDTIDLSDVSDPITVTFTGDEAGTITDGADTIQFTEIEKIVLTDQADYVDGSGDSAGLDIDAGAGDDSIIGGSGDDTITGGTGDDIFVYAPSGGNDTITDFNTGNTGTLNDGDSTNNDFIDLSSYYDHISELYVDHADDGILNQSNATDTHGNATDYSDNTSFGSGSLRMQGASADSSSFTAENTGVVCFTSGTAISTPLGDVLIDDLEVGNLVTTLDNGPQPIRWIGRRELCREELASNENLRPILIKQGVLGAERDLLVSPQHGMLIGKNNLARAKHLIKQPSIRVSHGKRQVTYLHLMFDDRQIIFAEKIPTESFYPGPMALAMMSEAALVEMFTLFPDLQKRDTANQR